LTRTIEVLPDPVSLIESMRAIGYTPETALADLIDNSISADATCVQIEYDGTSDPFVAVLDDGYGMTAAGITKAMRHGSRNPVDTRSAQDLGRFGLGLKTASLSQCRRLTVVSKQGENVHVRCWDLDIVREKKRWVVVVPGVRECRKLPLYEELMGQDSGTLVIWQQLDRLMSGSLNPAAEMTARMSDLHQHLSFVFHRYSRREHGIAAVAISINGLPLKSIDPFLKDSSFTQPLEGQVISVEGESINVQPYVLPHVSHLTPDEAATAGGREGLRSSQGFYVYRNRRLVIWGTWFRLVPKEEFYKLTRVQVDIPNTLDHLWALDIKKSAAYPPDTIRNRLRELIPHFAGTSRKTVTFPGRRQKHPAGFEPLWTRMEPSQGAFRYELNPDHALIRCLADSLDTSSQKALQQILELAASALPLESIYADMCGDRRTDQGIGYAETAAMTARIMSLTGLSLETALTLDPVARLPQHHEQLRKELRQ
jgi:hypothetical protein